MKHAYAALGSALFLVVAPGTVAGLIPAWISDGRTVTASVPLILPGGLLLGLGGLLLLDCFRRFVRHGGTPAPIAPTERLVVTGAYRHVRNPMYVAVVALILGQAALFADWRLLAYGLAVWAGFHAFVLAYEEPTLRRQFPADYAAFFAAVPRWRPRLRPWTPG
jgi:protein-S-isoprenylcysteine O-methyltransferase Ste14